jgi:hypothetical protein
VLFTITLDSSNGAELDGRGVLNARRKKRNAYTILVKKPVENRPLGTPNTESKLVLKLI